jgi:thioredoxin 1
MAYTEVNKDNLERLVEDSAMLVIDFWAEWCGPCKSFGPIFEKVSERHPDVTFAKCNTEVEREVAAAFDVRSIPTLAIFRDSVLLFKEAGAFPEHLLEEIIEKVQVLDMQEVHAEIAKAADEASNGNAKDNGGSGGDAKDDAKDDAN